MEIRIFKKHYLNIAATERAHEFFAIFCLLCVALWPIDSGAHGVSGTSAMEMMLFTQVDAIQYVGDNKDLVEDESEIEPSVDLFVSKHFSGFDVLGELFLSEDEQEFERLQFGWFLGQSNKVWVGRFHNPLGFWNTEFHHGAYLQTGVQRPWVTEFEDDGGVLAAHITGVLMEGEKLFEDGSSMRYALSLGYGPEITDEVELEPVENFVVGDGEHDIGFTINAAFLPDSLATNLAGASLSFAEIPIDLAGMDTVSQAILGLYANWNWHPVNVIAASFLVDDEVKSDTQAVDGSFVSNYVQLNYKAGDHWTAYGRYEKTNNSDDPYLALRGGYIENRSLAGVRYDFMEIHSVQFEYSQDEISSLTFDKIIFQWNAVFSK